MTIRTFARRAFAYTATLLCMLVLVTHGALAASREEIAEMVAAEAERNGHVPVALALAVARVESNFNKDAISSAGARGVMQIMPSTAMGEYGVSEDSLMSPRLNIELGVDYLERLYHQYGNNWQLALSHYNGGGLQMIGGRYVAHDYNRQYVADVFRWARTYQTDETGLALLDSATRVRPILASSEWDGGYDAGTVETVQEAEPNWQRIDGEPREGDRYLSSMLAQSKSELRERFRAHLKSRADEDGTFEDRGGDRRNSPDQDGWSEATGLPEHANSGRFNYAPYGGGHLR